MANKEFEIRTKRMTDVAAGRIPDRVPVCALMENYAFAYANATVADAQKSIFKHVKSYNKIYEDIYYDCAFMPSMSHALKLSQGLGSDVFFVSDDGLDRIGRLESSRRGCRHGGGVRVVFHEAA